MHFFFSNTTWPSAIFSAFAGQTFTQREHALHFDISKDGRGLESVLLLLKKFSTVPMTRDRNVPFFPSPILM